MRCGPLSHYKDFSQNEELFYNKAVFGQLAPRGILKFRTWLPPERTVNSCACCCMFLTLTNVLGAVHNHVRGSTCFYPGPQVVGSVRPVEVGQGSGSGTRHSAWPYKSPREGATCKRQMWSCLQPEDHL